MKKIIVAIALVVIPAIARAQFPTNYNSTTVNVQRLTTDYSDFQWKWRGWDDQHCRMLFTNNGSRFTIPGYCLAMQIVKDDTLYVFVDNTNISKWVDYCWFSISHTNIPPNGVYKADMIMYSGWTTNVGTTNVNFVTNMTRSIAQGKVIVTDSLWANTNLDTYPFPEITFGNTTVTNETDPIYSSSAASSITSLRITAWDAMAAGTNLNYTR